MRRRRSVALDVERLGLIGLRSPAASVVIAVVLAIAAIFGIAKLTIDNSLSELFRTDTADFKLFEQVSRQFPSAEYDVLVVVEGKSLLSRDSIEKLRVDGGRFATDRRRAWRHLIVFSARAFDDGQAYRRRCFPATCLKARTMTTLVQRVKSNELIRGRLLSDNGKLALIVLSLEPSAVESAKLQSVAREIHQTTADDLQGADLSSQLSGVPIMQLEIRNALERDRLVYNLMGFLAGCAIAILFFRRVSFMIVAAAPPLLAVVFTLGTLGWFGFRLNMFLNAMAPLIMVISFSDSMQLTFAARDRMIERRGPTDGVSRGDHRRGTGLRSHPRDSRLVLLGLAELRFGLDPNLRRGGFPFDGHRAGDGAVARPGAWRSARPSRPELRRRSAQRRLRRHGVAPSLRLDRRAYGAKARPLRPGRHRRRVSSRGRLRPAAARYNLADQVPNAGQAMQASASLDAQLTGENPADVLIKFPDGANLYDAQTLDTISQTHDAIEQQTGVGNVWSVETSAPLARPAARQIGRRHA